MSLDPDHPLTDLLDRLEDAASDERMSIENVLDQFGDRAITPFMLLIAVMMVSPLSGVPGMPTFAAVLLVVLATQALFGRQQLWLPQRLRRFEIKSARVTKAVAWMRKPCAFLDRHAHPRLRFLTMGPLRVLALLVCAMVPLFWPPLELLPFFTSFGALIVTLLAFGLLTRDGIYVLGGYFVLAIAVGVVFIVI